MAAEHLTTEQQTLGKLALLHCPFCVATDDAYVVNLHQSNDPEHKGYHGVSVEVRL